MSTYYSTFIRRKGTGLTVWASYCVLSGLLALLILQSALSPLASAARRDVAQQPEYLARAGVSVVRIVATYSPQTLAPAISSKTKSTSTNILASTSVACTGLGVIVANWTDTTGGTNEQNAYIMTDGSLVSPKEFVCGAGPVPGTPAAKLLSLSSVRVYFSTAYNTVQQTGIIVNTNTVRCSTNKCSDGVSLFSFHSNTLLPLIKLPDSESVAQPDTAAIQLSLSSSNTATPSITSEPQQHLAPTAARMQEPTVGNSSNFEGLESGTPVVDAHGFLNGIYTKNGTKTKFFAAGGVRTLLNEQKLTTDAQHPNEVNDSWQNGITAYAQGPTQYSQANNDFKQAYAASNSQFQGAQTFIVLTTPAPSGSTPSGSNGTANNGITFPYIGFIPYLLLAIVAIGVVVLLLLLFLLNSLFRRAQRHRDFLEADKQATLQAQQIQEREGQQALVRAVPPRAHQPVQQPTNGTLNAPPLASLSSAPVAPVQSSALADYPTLDMNEVQRNEKPELDKTQPFSPLPQRGARDGEEHVGFEVVTSTNPGIKRKYKPNEDSLFAVRGMRNENGHTQQIGLFVVADGMGGHANGQDASRLAIQTIIDYLLPRLVHGEDTRETAEKLLVDSVQLANQAVHQHNIDNNADMGTTVTATLVVDETAHVANVGDSRTYLYRTSDGLTKVTRDHSVVASLVDAGIIKPDDIYTHPKRNQIYRSLGEKPFVEVDPFTVQLQPGDKLLLCSDGLWDMVRDPEIQHVLETPTPNPQQLGDNLIGAALNGGGEDNVSVIVVNVMNHAPKQPTPGLETIYVQDNVKMPPL